MTTTAQPAADAGLPKPDMGEAQHDELNRQFMEEAEKLSEPDRQLLLTLLRALLSDRRA